MREETPLTYKEPLLFILFLVAWFSLNRWILPWFGIPTCMSGDCGVDPPRAAVRDTIAAPTQQPDDAVAHDPQTVDRKGLSQ